jgi:ADP-heptose:LPS heptosyltransferase
LHDGLTPEKVAGYIRRAQAVVSVDTAIVHMAVGLKAKLVAIYPLIAGQHNPWLPPRSPFTQVIYSEQQPDTLRRTGKKYGYFFANVINERIADSLNTASRSEKQHVA